MSDRCPWCGREQPGPVVDGNGIARLMRRAVEESKRREIVDRLRRAVEEG